jgi:hypothetical protein
MIQPKNRIVFLLFLLSVFLFYGIIVWGNTLFIKESFSSQDLNSSMSHSSTSHTVNLPINTTTSCENICGPQARCLITGQQCTTDIDCYGCQPVQKKDPEQTEDVRGQNDAGKLTSGFTPTYSTLTTDIGTQTSLYDITKGENINPVQYFNGVNQWRNAFDTGMEQYDQRYNSQLASLSFLPHYPQRPTLSGQFIDNGPLASNAYL